MANTSKRRFMELASVLCDHLFASFSTVAINSQIEHETYEWPFARELGTLLLRQSMGIKHDPTALLASVDLKIEDWLHLCRECPVSFVTADDIKQFAILLRKTFELYVYDLNLERGTFPMFPSTSMIS